MLLNAYWNGNRVVDGKAKAKLSTRIFTSVAFICTSNTAHAETKAGTVIDNIAVVRYDAAGGTASATSNRDTVIVAERLDVTLERRTTGPIAGDATAIAVALTNRGNGDEAFDLSATDDAGAPLARFAIDRDGDGRYDPAIDQILTAPRSAALAPGQALRLLLLADTGGGFRGSLITIVATAVTGSGAAGTVFSGQGDGGGDAETGVTGARAEVSVAKAGQAVSPSLVKTQSVFAVDGSTRPQQDAVVTYTLTATFPSDAAAARIDDPVPAGTAYVPGSLTLDGVPLTDAADGDAGDATPRAVAARLGDLPAGAVRTLQFKVRIQ